MMAKKSEKITLRETFRIHYRAFQDIRKYCPGIFVVTALHSIVSALSPYVTIYLSARIINELAGLRRADVLWPLVLLTIGSTALLALLSGILFRYKVAMSAKYSVRKNYIFADKMLSMDFADIDKTETHDTLSQIKQSEQWEGWGLNRLFGFFSDFLQSIFGILGAIALTVSLFMMQVPKTAGALTVLNHPAFILAFIAALALAAGLSPMCKNKAVAHEVACAEDALFGNRLFIAFGYMSSDQSRALDIRMYNQQVMARHYMDENNAFSVGGKMSKLAAGPAGAWTAASACISAGLTGVVYVFVCLKAWAGAFSVGSVTQYVGAVTALSKNISLMIETIGTMKGNVPFMRTTYQFLDIPNKMYQGSLTTEKRADRKYEVEFKNVSFKYPGSSQWSLRHVNIKFQVGKRLAVVGENGSGKTTFIKLLCRLYDPQEGQILLNGIDIRKYNYRDYMDVFSVVFQDFQLLSQPLGANVAGSLTYDRERVRKALIDAGFGERLNAMPQGLDTYLYRDLEESGVDVSGGEAQKIAIARALYKDAPFIILDEPTAALDPIAEAEIYSKFNEIAGDKTAIYISHRLSSCKFCDEILVFDAGALIQQGTHEELLADETGKYCELWNAQAQYYTNKAV